MSQVVRRSAAILRALQNEPAGLSVGAIATEVDLPRSTVHRLLKSLEEEHFVSAGSDRAGFRLGPALIQLSTSASAWLVDAVHEHLVSISAQTSETVDLAVLSGARVHFVDHVTGPNPLQAASEVGLNFPLHCTANGKALLAEMSNERVRSLLDGTLDALTPKTITKMDVLLAELEVVRETGVAFDREEHNANISAVGFKVDNPYGLAVAISIPVPTSRFENTENELVKALLAGRLLIEDHFAATANSQN